jgi:hypothetical protein
MYSFICSDYTHIDSNAREARIPKNLHMREPLLMTCTYFIDGERVWMAYQTQKIIGRKGYGGGINQGETWRQCCTREVREESGADPARRIVRNKEGGIFFKEEDLLPFALISFYNGTVDEVPPGNPSCTVLFSRCVHFIGTPIDTMEMVDPRTYWVKSLPYKKMITGDFLFITPETLLGKEYKIGTIRQTSDFKKILDHNIKNCSIEDLVFEKRPL